MTKIKICGLFRKDDILAVNSLIPDYAGFIINYPKSHRSISFDKVYELKSLLDPKITSVGVFVNQNISDISSLANNNAIDYIQLHGNEDNSYIFKLKQQTNAPVIKAFIIKSSEDVLNAVSSNADYILLDGGMGNGRQFNYNYIQDINKPFFIAGGLTPENIREIAIKTDAFAVDISSGVEINGVKSYEKMANAINALHRKEC